MAAELYAHQCRKVTLSNILLLHGIRYDICGKGATIQYPGGGAEVFVASKLFISTGLGGALKISHFSRRVRQKLFI